jgi:hypothetical protein
MDIMENLEEEKRPALVNTIGAILKSFSVYTPENPQSPDRFHSTRGTTQTTIHAN